MNRVRAGGRRQACLIAACLLASAAIACEKETHRAARRDFQDILERDLSPVERAAELEGFVAAYPEPKTNPYLVRSCSLLAEHHARAGKPDIAASWYERAVRASPDDPDLLNALGYHYARNGMNLDRAVTVLEAAVRLAEERRYSARRQGFIKDSLGWSYRARGDLPLAVAILEEADRLAPGVPVIREHLADAYRAIGERDRAVVILLDLFLAARGADRDRRATLEAIGREGGPALSAEVSRRIQAGLRRLAEADRREAEKDGAQLVRVPADDGTRLAGSLFLPRDPPSRRPGGRTGAVLLLHALGSSRRAAVPVARALADRGLVALALDLRGHGSNVSEAIPNSHEFSTHLADNLRRSRADAVAALAFLARQPRVDPGRLAVVGAGLGGLIAAQAAGPAATDQGAPPAAALAILSPWGRAEAYRPQVEALSPDAVILICGSDQENARSVVQALAATPAGPSRTTIIVPGPGEGYELEEQMPDLPARLADLLAGRLGRAPQPGKGPGPR